MLIVNAETNLDIFAEGKTFGRCILYCGLDESLAVIPPASLTTLLNHVKPCWTSSRPPARLNYQLTPWIFGSLFEPSAALLIVFYPPGCLPECSAFLLNPLLPSRTLNCLFKPITSLKNLVLSWTYIWLPIGICGCFAKQLGYSRKPLGCFCKLLPAVLHLCMADFVNLMAIFTTSVLSLNLLMSSWLRFSLDCPPAALAVFVNFWIKNSK